mmetsp:Transcript_4258/g.9274  ORF Transcript_4258/g.9274 Transcript_4258/m.9274 type:complete len:93 (+) Transcript_4258:316-594(+)
MMRKEMRNARILVRYGGRRMSSRNGGIKAMKPAMMKNCQNGTVLDGVFGCQRFASFTKNGRVNGCLCCVASAKEPNAIMMNSSSRSSKSSSS